MCRIISFFYGIYLSLLSLFLCWPVFAQNKYAYDTAEINNSLQEAYKVLNPDSEIILFNKILEMSIKANYANGAFKSLMTKGIKYWEKEDYNKARACYKDALNWSSKSSYKHATAWCYNNIGDAWLSEGEYSKASEYFYVALNEIEKAPHYPTNVAANIYGNLGHLNDRLKQPEKALEFYNKAIQIAKEGNLYFQLAENYRNIGGIYTLKHQKDSALLYFNEVMSIGQRIGKVDLKAFANEDLGKMYIEFGEYAKAVPYLQTAIQLSRNSFNDIVIESNYALGNAWLHMNNYKEAEDILVAALKETKAHNIKDKYIYCYTLLNSVYRAMGQYKQALDCMDSITLYKDMLTGKEKSRAINQMEIKFKTAEKDKQIAQQQDKITKKNILILSIASAILLLSLIFIMLFNRTKHKQNLQAEQIKLLEKENKIAILKAMVKGGDDERSRLARELHDGIGGMLSAALMRFRYLQHDKTISLNPEFNDSIKMLDDMADEIRKTAHNLMPDVLLKQDLIGAIRDYCNSVQEEALNIDFQHYGTLDNLSLDFKLNIYRIVQELLKNIKQHAKASHTLVQLVANDNTLNITVEDNGIGFEKEKEKEKGIGLHNIETRVSSMDGIFTLESEPGRGTTVYIELMNIKK